MNIRIAKIKDTIQIDKLLKQLGYVPDNNNFVKCQIKKSLIKSNMKIFVAEENGVIIGFLSLGLIEVTSGNRKERKSAHIFYIKNGYQEESNSKLFRKKLL